MRILSRVYFSFVLVVPAVAPTTMPGTMPATQPVDITWDQAKDHIGQLATVVGPVVGTHDFGDAAVLNVGKDFPSRERFTVFIPEKKRKGMPQDLDNGKTISVTGTLKLYHNVPEIEAGVTDIEIVDSPKK